MSNNWPMHIIDISTSVDIANQHVLERDETPIVHNESEEKTVLYNRYQNIRRRRAAFRLVHEPNEQQCQFRVPLKIVASVPHYGPGHYFMVWKDYAGFQLASRPFYLNLDVVPEKGTCVVENIGPFYANVNVESPFWVSLDQWSIHRCETTEEIGSDNHELDVYFFLGSASLPLNGLPTRDVHYGPLIRYTIPRLEDVINKSWCEIESSIIKGVALRLWGLGGQTFCYDKTSGSPSFLDSNLSFHLGKMLEATVVGPEFKTCNCFDLAAFVYTAFKSFGCKIDPATGLERDIFHITTNLIQGVGYMPPGRLFGWHDSTYFADTEPFWRKPIRADEIGYEVDQQTRDQARQQGGMWYVFLGCDDSYHCAPALPLLKPAFLFNANDPQRTRFSCHCFSVLRNYAGEEKVVDICVAFPYMNVNAGDIVESHILDDGSHDLDTYLSRGEQGGPQFDASTRQEIYIGSFYVTNPPGSR